jgi:hypothetical protein
MARRHPTRCYFAAVRWWLTRQIVPLPSSVTAVLERGECFVGEHPLEERRGIRVVERVDQPLLRPAVTEDAAVANRAEVDERPLHLTCVRLELTAGEDVSRRLDRRVQAVAGRQGPRRPRAAQGSGRSCPAPIQQRIVEKGYPLVPQSRADRVVGRGIVGRTKIHLDEQPEGGGGAGSVDRSVEGEEAHVVRIAAHAHGRQPRVAQRP